ncbi:MAG: ABC transporter substrate-binding protein [Calditrichaeota bacterium]|nr:ABC transporter substrate-binding protein [Calditrichota bacterium]
MRKWLILLLLFWLSMPLYAQKKYVIKFATLAPEGSTWLNVMKAFDAEIRELTNGEVRFKIYAGGIQGDEKDVLRKIRLGQLHSAGFTGVGLGEILPEVRILDAPLLFRNYEEIDYITNLLYDEFFEKFRKVGYALIGWTEVGFVYVYSKKPITTLQDLKNTKMWMWEGDPVAEATFRALGVSAIPLSVTDVLTSLQTNLIEAVYTSPLACVSLQWYTKVKYMMDVPLADATGAILISNRMFNKLPEKYQRLLIEKGREHMAELIKQSRVDNEKAIEIMLKNGIQLVHVPEENLGAFYEAGARARRNLVGKLYSQEFLTRIETALEEFRARKSSSQ